MSSTTERPAPGRESPPPADRDRGDETPPKASVSGADADAAGGDDDSEDGHLGSSESRGHDDRVVSRTVQAKNSFSDSNIWVEGDFIIGEDQRLSVPVADVTRSVTLARDTFVEPDYFPELKDALATQNVVLLAGAACGKRTAAGVALQLTGHEPILQLPADMAVRSLVDGIKRVCRRSPTAGILIESMDSTTLTTLAGFEIKRLDDLLAGGAAVILTVKLVDGTSPALDGVVTFQCSSPSPRRVIERSGATSAAQKAAAATLELLRDHVLSPSDVLDLLAQADESGQTPERLAQTFDGQATRLALDRWLSVERPADQVAALAAAAALDGTAIVDVDRVARVLLGMFTADFEEADQGAKTFKAADRGWPDGVVAVARAARGTHFGRHQVEVAAVCSPHTRTRIVAYLWSHLGSDFRGPFIEWLRGLAADQDAEIRLGAAVTAGILFALDPVIAERELIKPWALDQSFSRRLCAAIALGAPVAIGADPAGARALTRSWSDSTDQRLRHVAVLAYGGLLGGWDPGSAAATHLWRIGTETPELTRAANTSLAALTAAGGSAARVRATVIGLLSAQAELERAPRRVYALLPLILKHLTAPGDLSRDSLTALVNDENETFVGLTSLIAKALTASSGHTSARAALETLLQATADGRVEQRTALKIVSELRQVALAGSGHLEALDAQLERVMWANVRCGPPVADVAELMLNELFPSS